jgi:integrase
VIEPERLAEMMAQIYTTMDNGTGHRAVQVAAYTFQRPGNVASMEWAELDLENAMWTIPAAKMKQEQELKREAKFSHFVPLSRQLVHLLKTWKLESQPGARFVFENAREKVRHLRPMVLGTMNDALARLGFGEEQKTHGFRAVARTVGRSQCRIDSDVLEAQLAHSNGDSNGTAYDREKFLPERIEAMQVWADYLDGLRKGATPLKNAA